MIATLFALLAIITAPYAPVSYSCNGVTAAFAVTFPYQDLNHVVAISTTGAGVATTLSYTTDYTLSVVSTLGTATLTLTNPAVKCPTGSTLKISRVVPLTQPTNFAAQLSFRPELHTAVADLLEMQIQQVNALSPPSLLTTKGDLLGRNANSPVRVPVGTTSQVLMADPTSAAGLSWVAPTVPAETSQPGLGSKAPFINVRAAPYFAVGDGVADDTAAIQAALDGLPNGGTVYVPPGQYLLSSALSINANGIVLRGAGYGRSTSANFGSRLVFTGATNGIQITGVVGGRSGIAIEYLSIISDNVAALSAIKVGDGTSGAVFSTIRNVHIETTTRTAAIWTTGIQFINTQNFSVDTSVLFGNVGNNSGIVTGIAMDGNTRAVTFYEVDITGSGQGVTADGVKTTGAGAEFYWYGGTIQGGFTHSAFDVEDATGGIFSTHVEITAGAGKALIYDNQTQARNFVAVGANFNKDVAIAPSGSVYNFSMWGGNANNITTGANAFNTILWPAYVNGAITDGATNTQIGPYITVGSTTPSVAKFPNLNLSSGRIVNLFAVTDAAASNTHGVVAFGSNNSLPTIRMLDNSGNDSLVLKNTTGGWRFSPVSGSSTGFDNGIYGDASGFKHKRVSTGSIGATTDSAVAVTWGTTFADANYTVTCSVVDSTASASSLKVIHLDSVVAATATVRVRNDSAGALTGTLHCIAIHD